MLVKLCSAVDFILAASGAGFDAEAWLGIIIHQHHLSARDTDRRLADMM